MELSAHVGVYTVRRREEGYDAGTQGVVDKRRGAAGQSEINERTREQFTVRL